MKRKKPIRKRSIAKTLLQKSRRDCEASWKEAVKRRDKFCQIHGATCKRGPLQADHFESRRHGSTFLDPRNGTLVCGHANRAKSRGWENMGYKIGMVVLRREGYEVVKELQTLAKQTKKWSLQELEDQKMFLDGLWR